MPNRSVRVEVLYLEGCPHFAPAANLVEQVVTELGAPILVSTVLIRDAAEAERHLFLGSPTVRVNGVDVEPAARNRTQYGWGCRQYGGAGVPPKEMIIAAIREQVLQRRENAAQSTRSSDSNCSTSG